MSARRISLPDEAHRELLDAVAQTLGRPPEPHEVGTELARVIRTAKAATRNADRARLAADKRGQQRRNDEAAKVRASIANALGRPDLQHGIYRSGADVAPDSPGFIPDTRIQLQTRAGAAFVPDANEYPEIQVRSWWGIPNGDEPLDVSKVTGIVGTPFAAVPMVEQNADLYPYQGRGLSYNQGQFEAAFRSDPIIREGISSLVAIQAGATVEYICPPDLTKQAAERLGIDRDQIERVAEELNLALLFARRVDFKARFEEQLRTACVNGFGLVELTMDPSAPIQRRITGLSPRLPNTVMQWIQNPTTSELVAILQTNPNGSMMQLAPALDARKCILLSIDRNGDNFEGLSLVRTARGYDVLGYEFLASAILHRQRFGPGVPVIRRTNGTPGSAAASNEAFRALSQYANLADAVLELGDGTEVEMLQMMAEQGLVEVIDLCTKMKRSAVRDSIAGLGVDGVGAYNLGDIKSQLWLKGLKALARQVERAWNRLSELYCDVYHPGMMVQPVLSVTGFATRSANETITVHEGFARLQASGSYTNAELVDIAREADVRWNGRGEEASALDAEAATAAEPAVDGKPAPAGAQKAAASGRRVRSTAETKWTPTAEDARLANKVLRGVPLDNADLRMLQAFFDAIEGDPTEHAEWADKGPFWQAFQSFGGQPMADWLGVELAEADEVPTVDDEEPETRAPQKYAHIDFQPPQGVRDAAKRGLEVRASKPPSERGGTEVGVARARDLANGRTVSPDTARRMKAYFDRHEVDKQGGTWDEQGKGWQAWQLWGGDAGRSWAAKLVRQMEAADAETTTRHAGGCTCGACADPMTRAKQPLFAVPTRTGEFRTWRALTPTEQAVSFDRIAEEKRAAVERASKAVESEQRQHRAEWVRRSQGLGVAAIAALTVDWTERYRAAMLPALRSLSDFARTDTLQEIASQIGVPQWVASAEQATGAAAQVEAAATLAAKAVNDRANERFRGAAVQVANGGRSTILSAAPVSIGTTAGALLEQTASTTVNETRAVTAAEEGPEIVSAVYSAVMDRYTCPACRKADGRRVKYGSDEYRRLTPPNPQCLSVKNSGGAQNLCQCVWVYEYAKPDVTPGPVNPTGGGLTIRSATQTQPVRVVLVCGPPGSGKSTWARDQDGEVIDRDEYVLTDDGYNPSGRAESLAALTDAVQAAAPGEAVYFVACMLTPAARQRVAEHVRATADRDLVVSIHAIDRPADELREINAAREDSERGSIPPDQLEHLMDAWCPPEPGELE
jgi:hypothetical protein